MLLFVLFTSKKCELINKILQKNLLFQHEARIWNYDIHSRKLRETPALTSSRCKSLNWLFLDPHHMSTCLTWKLNASRKVSRKFSMVVWFLTEIWMKNYLSVGKYSKSKVASIGNYLFTSTTRAALWWKRMIHFIHHSLVVMVFHSRWVIQSVFSSIV